MTRIKKTRKRDHKKNTRPGKGAAAFKKGSRKQRGKNKE